MDSDLYTRLSTDAGITALVGTNIYPVFPTPDSSLPYLAYQRTSTEDNLTLNGPVSLQAMEYTIDTWSINAVTCRAIADAVYASLSTWRSSPVQGSFLKQDIQEQTDVGFHGQSTWQIWS